MNLKNILFSIIITLIPISLSAQCTLTQSTDNSTFEIGVTISCNTAGEHMDNFYYRTFDLSSCGSAGDVVAVTDIDLGIQQATSSGGTQPMTINLYTVLTGTFPTGFTPGTGGTLIGTANFNVADQTETVSNFVVSSSAITIGTVDLVVEVFTPNGQGTGESFFIGANSAGQTAPSYLAAPGCSINNPTDLTGIAPNMHILMDVNLEPLSPVAAADIPTLSEWGLIILALLLMTFGTLYLVSFNKEGVTFLPEENK